MNSTPVWLYAGPQADREPLLQLRMRFLRDVLTRIAFADLCHFSSAVATVIALDKKAQLPCQGTLDFCAAQAQTPSCLRAFKSLIQRPDVFQLAVQTCREACQFEGAT